MPTAHCKQLKLLNLLTIVGCKGARPARDDCANQSHRGGFMKFLAISIIPALLIVPALALAGQGPKGGPSFPDYNWTEIVATDFSTTERWEPRAGLQAVELHNQLFVIARRTPSPTFDNPFASLIHGDVWVSADLGETWTELLADAESSGLWKNRAYFEAVTQGGYMYVMGGQNFTTFIPEPPFVRPSEFFKDVWRSKDGMNWEEVTGPEGAGWSPRPGHKCSVVVNYFVCMGGFAALDPFPPFFDTNPSDIWVSKDRADWEKVSDSPWDNDPSYADCIFASPPQLPIACDDVRYDFDILTVTGGHGGMKPSIFTFGGDREIFVPIPGNEFRVENDVWRYSPKD